MALTTGAVPSSGLVGGSYDWSRKLPQAGRPLQQDVVVEFSGNAFEPYAQDESGATSSEPTPALLRRVGSGRRPARQGLRRLGARVLWVLVPPVRDRTLQVRNARINDIHRQVADRYEGIQLVDWRRILAPGGEYTDVLHTPGGDVSRSASPTASTSPPRVRELAGMATAQALRDGS